MINYEPEPGIALVKLTPKYSGIKAPEKKWDSVTEGEIIKVNDAQLKIDIGNLGDKQYLIGRTGYWEEFKDSIHLTDDYAFIKISDILGTSERGENVTHTKANN